MNTSLPLIDTKLDQSIEFQSIQFLADSEGDRDVLGGKKDRGIEQNWGKIRQFATQCLTDHHDCRLNVLLYRAELVLGDIFTALNQLSSWEQLFELSSEQLQELVSADQQHQMAVTLSYFFSDSHLLELRQSLIVKQIECMTGDLLQHVTDSGDASHDVHDLDAVQKWLKNNHDVLPLLDLSKSRLKKLADWMASHNQTGLTLQIDKVSKWLSKLEDVLIQLGAIRKGVALTHSESGYAEVLTNGAGPGASLTLDPAIASMQNWNRAYVDELLGKMCLWFEIHEPTHPAPYLLRRARKIIHCDFLTLMNELMPESVSQFEKLAGLDKSK